MVYTLFSVIFFTFSAIKSVLIGFRPNLLIFEEFRYYIFDFCKKFFLGYHVLPRIGAYVSHKRKIGKNTKISKCVRGAKNQVLRSKISEIRANSISKTVKNPILYCEGSNRRNRKIDFLTIFERYQFLGILVKFSVFFIFFSCTKIIFDLVAKFFFTM